MCAICGVLDWKSQKEIEREDILRMQAALRHRGPDGSGMLMRKGAALGRSEERRVGKECRL